MDNSETCSEGLSDLAQNSRRITIQAGERRFFTTEGTLTGESGFFAALLPGRWDNAQPDGSYFIDADPELFDHILCYLRRGVLPVFYDGVKGHDYRLYSALLEEARYFQIPRLQTWLEKKSYLDAIKIEYSAYTMEDNDIRLSILGANEELCFSSTTPMSRQVYVCPREIFVHRGNPEKCGKRCIGARTGSIDEYETENYVTTLVVRKRTFVNSAAFENV